LIKVKEMKNNKTILVFILGIFLALLKINSVWAETENVTLTTYYPSPQGSYNTIDITEQAKISDKLTLSGGAVLESDTTYIAGDGRIKSNALIFKGQKYSTPNLKSRELTANNLSGGLTTWGRDFDAPTSLYPVDCGDGLVNNIWNISFLVTTPIGWNTPEGRVNPFICIPIPTGEGVHILLCFGQESFGMRYNCLVPE